VVVVEAHYHFCIAVVEGDGMDLDQYFTWSWRWEGKAGEGDVRDAGLCSEPLAVLGGERHRCRCYEEVKFEEKKETWRTVEEGKGREGKGRRDMEEMRNGNQYTRK
jgi:hypothetical protein